MLMFLVFVVGFVAGLATERTATKALTRRARADLEASLRG